VTTASRVDTLLIAPFGPGGYPTMGSRRFFCFGRRPSQWSAELALPLALPRKPRFALLFTSVSDSVYGTATDEVYFQGNGSISARQQVTPGLKYLTSSLAKVFSRNIFRPGAERTVCSDNILWGLLFRPGSGPTSTGYRDFPGRPGSVAAERRDSL